MSFPNPILVFTSPSGLLPALYQFLHKRSVTNPCVASTSSTHLVFSLTDGEFNNAVRLLVGVPLCERYHAVLPNGRCPLCNAEFTEGHDRICKAIGGATIARHNATTVALFRFASNHGRVCRMEMRTTTRGTTYQPDLTTVSEELSNANHLDVTWGEVLARSEAYRRAALGGAIPRHKEAQKRSKVGPWMRLQDGNPSFTPFALSSVGQLGDSAKAWIREVCSTEVDLERVSGSHTTSSIIAELSCIAARYAYRMQREYCRRLNGRLAIRVFPGALGFPRWSQIWLSSCFL